MPLSNEPYREGGSWSTPLGEHFMLTCNMCLADRKHARYVSGISLLMIVLVLSSNQTKAQSASTYVDAWLMTLNHFDLKKEWRLGNELHWRNTRFIADREQLLVRPFITYKMEKIDFSIGYSYIRSYPYRIDEIQTPRSEHNVWQQVTLNHQVGKLSFAHRYRLEERFQGLPIKESDESLGKAHIFSNRFRYRVSVRHRLSRKHFLQLFNELWIRMDRSFGHAVFDRNWLYAGLGTMVREDMSIQMAYLHQVIHLSGTKYEYHPTLQVTLQYDFKKKEH